MSIKRFGKMSYNDFLQKLKFLGEPLTNQHVSHLRMIILLTENQSDCRRLDPDFSLDMKKEPSVFKVITTRTLLVL